MVSVLKNEFKNELCPSLDTSNILILLQPLLTGWTIWLHTTETTGQNTLKFDTQPDIYYDIDIRKERDCQNSPPKGMKRISKILWIHKITVMSQNTT